MSTESTERLKLDDELRGVLASIAANPKAKLFRHDRDVARAVLRGESIVRRPTESGLLAAERELLRVHRASLALLLRHAALRALDEAKGPDSKFLIDFPVWDRERILREVRGLRATGATHLSDAGFTQPASLDEALALAKSALMLEDHLSPLICITGVLTLRGRPDLAKSALLRARRARPGDPGDHYMLDNLGFAEAEVENNGEAMKYFLAAAQSEPFRAVYWARAFIESIVVGDSSVALRSSAVLDDLPEPTLYPLDWVRRDFELWDPHPSQREVAKTTARSLEKRLAGPSRSLVESLLE